MGRREERRERAMEGGTAGRGTGGEGVGTKERRGRRLEEERRERKIRGHREGDVWIIHS